MFDPKKRKYTIMLMICDIEVSISQAVNCYHNTQTYLEEDPILPAVAHACFVKDNESVG